MKRTPRQISHPIVNAESKSFYNTTRLIVLAGVAVAVLGLWVRRPVSEPPIKPNLVDPNSPPAISSTKFVNRSRGGFWARRESVAPTPRESAEQVVAHKLNQFVVGRRQLFFSLAAKLGLPVAPEVESFFELAKTANRTELNAAFEALRKRRDAGDKALKKVWTAILETVGVAEIVHEWPAEKLMQYGERIMNSLPPGAVYLGGTDPGRFIPTLLNDTDTGDRHIVMTQNALADGEYADYLQMVYGDQLNALTQVDAVKAFETYLADAKRRLVHDEQFPDEPKQLRPNEQVIIQSDGRVQVGGQSAVMAINDRLLQLLRDKNPGVPFVLEESYPLEQSYAFSVPLGPVLQLGGREPGTPLTSDTAAAAVDYWRGVADDYTVAGDSGVLADRMAYAKMAAAQAQWLVEHNFPQEAEAAFRYGLEICPTSPEAVLRYTNFLAGQGQFPKALSLVRKALRYAPGNEDFVSLQATLQTQTSLAN